LYDVAQASAAECSNDAREERAVGARLDEVATEPAQWRAVPRGVPSCEDPAFESETDGDPAAPDADGAARVIIGRTPRLWSSCERPQFVVVSYTARFAASLVLARAPPRHASPRADA
jgi:hypothetical protein